MDGIAVSAPLSEQGYRIAICSGQVFYILTIAIGSSRTVRLGIPACKGIADSGIGIISQVGCNVKNHWLVIHTAAVRCIAVIFDGIVVDPPLGKQGYRIAICSGQVFYILTIAIGGSCAVGMGIPANKGMACFGIAVGRQVGRRIVGHGLIICRATIRCVTFKFYGVLVRFPESVKSIVVSINRNNIICSIGMAGTITFGVP